MLMGPQGQAVGVCGFVVVCPMRNSLGDTGFLGLFLRNGDSRSVPSL